MAKQNTTKKHIVTSFHNLTPELQDAVKEKYPLGFTEAMMRVDKPNGDFFYAVPFDTDEIAYMVKIDVKIDDTFADPAFERFCLGMFDLDHDGRISRYEAQRVLAMDCSGRNISAMWEIGEFSRLRELDCSGNNLTRLDLRKCPDLQKLDCGDNEITSLDIDGLRGLTQLDCAENLLARLDLKSNSSLRSLDCRGYLLVTLDLPPPCSGQLQADTRDNPFLTTVYCLASQGVDRNGPTEVVVR